MIPPPHPPGSVAANLTAFAVSGKASTAMPTHDEMEGGRFLRPGVVRSRFWASSLAFP